MAQQPFKVTCYFDDLPSQLKFILFHHHSLLVNFSVFFCLHFYVLKI